MMAEHKRLFIGGLGKTVSEDDLKERLSRYGVVESVEMKSKNTIDESAKLFAYVNILATADALKKCFKTYNNTKWKGGELKLQFAKESFLKKLAEERLKGAEEEEEKPPAAKRKKVILKDDSPALKDIKGGKPGTEVPGETEWIVGKYGRILPVMHMRRRDKKKTLTLDPSKHCHQIKRIKDDEEDDNANNVKKLTWELQEKDSAVMKKIKGEFPDYKPKKKKKKISSEEPTSEKTSLDNSTCGSNSDKEGDSPLPVVESKSLAMEADSDNDSASSEDSDGSASNENERSQLGLVNGSKHSSGTETDSEDPSDDDCEKPVVKTTDEENKQKVDIKQVSKSKQLPPKKTQKVAKQEEEKTESDSDDDQQQAIKKSGLPVRVQNTEKVNEMLESNDNTSEESDSNEEKINESSSNESVSDEEIKESDSNVSDSDEEEMNESRGESQNTSDNSLYLSADDNLEGNDGNESSSSADTDEILSRSKAKGVTKSAKVANKILDESEKELPEGKTSKHKLQSESMNKEDSDSEEDMDFSTPSMNRKIENVTKSGYDSASSADTDEILSSCKKPAKRVSTPQAQKVLHTQSVQKVVGKIKMVSEFDDGLQSVSHDSSDSDSDSDGEDEFEKYKKLELSVKSKKIETPLPKAKSDLTTDKKHTEVKKVNKETTPSKPKEDVTEKVVPSSSGTTVSKTETPGGQVESEEQVVPSAGSVESEKVKKPKRNRKEERKKHALDNQKRLESLRQKEMESKAQKSIIQKALTAVDAKGGSNCKHIKFDSDDDDDDEEEEKKDDADDDEEEESDKDSSDESDSSDGSVTIKKTKVKKLVKIGEKQTSSQGKPKLFDSEDEEDENEEEEDQEKFKLKPQFEGKAGEKLFALQSRYKSDERFKLDARFIENEGEKEKADAADDDDDAGDDKNSHTDGDVDEAAEKERQMKILQQVMGTSSIGSLKTDKKNIFKDQTAMHYDPSREDHSQYEIKLPAKEKTKKKSKEEKRREEAAAAEELAEPLPEVSKEKFFQVDTGISDLFGSKETNTFSFGFGGGPANQKNNDGDEGNAMATDAGTSSFWQPKLSYDSTSDEDEMEKDESEEKEDPTTFGFTSQAPKTFFFQENDARISEGISQFCREEDMESLREKWSEDRPNLIEACRMRRKRMLRLKRLNAIQQHKSKSAFKKTPARKPRN